VNTATADKATTKKPTTGLSQPISGKSKVTPEGLTIVTVLAGESVEFQGRSRFKGTVKLNQLFRIERDGEVLGHVRRVLATRERKTRQTDTIVQARWESPAWHYQTGTSKLTSLTSMTNGGPKSWFEAHSKGEAIEHLVSAVDYRARIDADRAKNATS
jgi:hypothetical protein